MFAYDVLHQLDRGQIAQRQAELNKEEGDGKEVEKVSRGNFECARQHLDAGDCGPMGVAVGFK